jgi:hypothetical protein
LILSRIGSLRRLLGQAPEQLSRPIGMPLLDGGQLVGFRVVRHSGIVRVGAGRDIEPGLPQLVEDRAGERRNIAPRVPLDCGDDSANPAQHLCVEEREHVA